MKTRTWIAGGVVVALGVAFTLVNFHGSTDAADPPKNDEQSILKAMQAYEAAFNKGDVDAIMTFWAADAEFISDDGKATRGRDAIAAQTKRAITEHKGLTVKLTNKSIRFIKPDVALQDGIVTLSAQDKPADSGPFTSVWSKTDGKWLLVSVRDLPDEMPTAGTNYSALKQLEWMVGEWTAQEKDVSVDMTVRWDKNQNFLLLENTIKLKGENLSITQFIGWDPSQQQIRSWIFDSRGGFGETFWTRQGNQWEGVAAGVLSDGRPTSSLNTWKYIDDHIAEWQSTQRQVDSQPMPDVKMKYVKKNVKK